MSLRRYIVWQVRRNWGRLRVLVTPLLLKIRSGAENSKFSPERVKRCSVTLLSFRGNTRSPSVIAIRRDGITSVDGRISVFE